jgi:hypothetical protein
MIHAIKRQFISPQHGLRNRILYSFVDQFFFTMKKSHFLLTGALSALLLSTSSCERQFSAVWVKYNETGCADPWGYDFEKESDKLSAIQDYLINEEGIECYKVSVGDPVQTSGCLACICETGNTLRAKIHEDNLQAAVAVGWYTEK